MTPTMAAGDPHATPCPEAIPASTPARSNARTWAVKRAPTGGHSAGPQGPTLTARGHAPHCRVVGAGQTRANPGEVPPVGLEPTTRGLKVACLQGKLSDYGLIILVSAGWPRSELTSWGHGWGHAPASGQCQPRPR